jgi:hypothetical protein
MRLRLIPRTLAGKWALGLSIAFIILIGIKILGFLPLPTFAVAALGLVGFIISIIAILKNKDRAVFTFIPVIVGLIIILWVAAELLFPH